MKPDRCVLIKGEWKYFLDREEVTREQYERRYPPVEHGGRLLEAKACDAWPMRSDALAVHPNQIEAAKARDAAHGIQTDYDHMGRPILRDRDHRRRMLRSFGYHDNDGGYSD